MTERQTMVPAVTMGTMYFERTDFFVVIAGAVALMAETSSAEAWPVSVLFLLGLAARVAATRF